MLTGPTHIIRIRRDRLNPLTGRRMYRVVGCELNHYPVLKRVWRFNQPQGQFSIVLVHAVKVGCFINPAKALIERHTQGNAS